MTDASCLATNAEFFALAVVAALDLKLLAVDLLLIENRRPPVMFRPWASPSACWMCWSSTPTPSTPRKR
jgi:hypothetical protein